MRAALQLVGGYLRRRPLAAALATGLFALGIGLITLLLLLDRQLTRQFSANLAGVDLVIGAKGSPLQLVTSSLYHADAPTGNIPISGVAAFGRPGHPLISEAIPLALGDSYAGSRIVGTTPEFFALYSARLAGGTFSREPFEVVVGARVAERLSLAPGDEFESVHGLDDNPDLAHADAPRFHVSGTLAPTGLVIDDLLLTDLGTVWEVHDHSPEDEHAEAPDGRPWYEESDRSITALLAKFSGRNTATLNFARNINENTDLMAATPAVVMAQFSARVADAEDVLRALAWVIVFASALALLVVLLNALRERRGDLGLLRSLGATPGFVFGLVLLEGLVLSQLGAGLGLLFGRLGFWAVSVRLRDTYPVGTTSFALMPEEGWIVLGALVLGALAALFPAWRAYRIDPGLESE